MHWTVTALTIIVTSASVQAVISGRSLILAGVMLYNLYNWIKEQIVKKSN